MKFVKRISLFFIYPLSMFSLGFAANMAIMEYFYPGDEKTVIMPEEPEVKVKEQIQVSVSDEPVVTADTQYIVQEYDMGDTTVQENEVKAPDKFIGLDRERLAEEIDNYNQNPSLTDLEKGFRYMELVSFSDKKVVVKKSYELPEEDKGFFLMNENHYVVVYDQSLTEVYMNTDILVEDLSAELQEEIIQMKYVENEKELFNFLESYSS
ncbi:MAG: hypothetical protein K2P38_00075 [Lachnospiraceae bacterium]|nr:hypothetical protein [Lachnospiraceae bacterium]